MVNIFIFGDSIAFGAWDKEGGWAGRLKRWVDEKNITEKRNLSGETFLVYNLSVPGDTTELVLERFDAEVQNRIEKGGRNVFIFQIGLNDSQYNLTKERYKVTFADYQQNLDKLYKRAQRYSQDIFFLDFPNVDEEKTTPIPWNKDKAYKNEYIEKYREGLEKYCRENNIIFLKLPDQLYLGKDNPFLEDGLHPNSDGHKLIFEMITEQLKMNSFK